MATLSDESYSIIGACMEVYNQMGFGFLEEVYQECLEIELTQRGVSYQSQQQLRLSYKGRRLNSIYVPDLICFEKVIVEIKGVRELIDAHRAQILNYLKATKLPLGLLINFGNPNQLQFERFVF